MRHGRQHQFYRFEYILMSKDILQCGGNKKRDINNNILVILVAGGNMQNMMKPISRRKFLQLAGISAVSIVSVSLPRLSKADEENGVIRVRIPIAWGTEMDSKKSFCQRATFPSAAAGMRVLASRKIEACLHIDYSN